jgi:WD40 repeat protein
MTLVAGCYERFIFGFDLPVDTSKVEASSLPVCSCHYSNLSTTESVGCAVLTAYLLQAQDLAKRFAYPGHQGAVKCLTAGGTFVVSGGADDQLHIYDTQVFFVGKPWHHFHTSQYSASACLSDDYVSITKTEDNVC